MSVLIEGMELPKDRPQLLWIYPNGKALTVQSDVDPWKELQAVPVPESHGRLIDTDAVTLEGGQYEYDDWCKWALEQYQDAPTVIPASESKERPAFLPQYELTPL